MEISVKFSKRELELFVKALQMGHVHNEAEKEGAEMYELSKKIDHLRVISNITTEIK